MHVCDADRRAVARVEIVPYSTTYHDSEREVLPLGIFYPITALGVCVSEASASLYVGCNPPVGLDKIVPHTCYESSYRDSGLLGM